MRCQSAGAPLNERKRGTLAPRFARTENLLAGIPDVENCNLEDVRRFSNALIAARDAWADANRCGRRYSDAQEARTFGAVFKNGGPR